MDRERIVNYKPIDQLKPYSNNARTHSKKQITQIARSIKIFGFNNPILLDENDVIISGHGRLTAAKQLGLIEVPTICLSHMTDSQKRAYILAENKLAEKAGWDQALLRMELENIALMDLDLDLTLTGFETPELDLIINSKDPNNETDLLDQEPAVNQVKPHVNRGDLWQLGKHYLYCGNALEQRSFDIVLGGNKAELVFIDPPYNVPINGHVGGNGKTQHSEFAFASGEMSEQEFIEFLTTSFDLLKNNSVDGSIHFVCIDWRHLLEIMLAGKKSYTELKNICVWNKQLGGMGSLYRSQHEMVFVFKNGKTPHINNIDLGKHGRYRTNVWDYPGIHVSNNHRDELKLHPTVKPVSMIEDAIKDCSKLGGIILDCFAGSGSTLLAAERCKRIAHLIEYEPKYCDVVIHRFELMTGQKAVLISQELESRHV